MADVIPISRKWTPAEIAEAHDALDDALKDSNHVLILGIGDELVTNHYIPGTKSKQSTMAMLGLLHHVIHEIHHRALEDDEE